eukprot:98756-Chlamydomonas_euryale.AAC.2
MAQHEVSNLEFNGQAASQLHLAERGSALATTTACHAAAGNAGRAPASQPCRFLRHATQRLVDRHKRCRQTQTGSQLHGGPGCAEDSALLPGLSVLDSALLPREVSCEEDSAAQRTQQPKELSSPKGRAAKKAKLPEQLGCPEDSAAQRAKLPTRPSCSKDLAAKKARLPRRLSCQERPAAQKIRLPRRPGCPERPCGGCNVLLIWAAAAERAAVRRMPCSHRITPSLLSEL